MASSTPFASDSGSASEDRSQKPTLLLLNSLTRSKEPFNPNSGGKRVKWYSCGPTVYDAAHMGHARTYISFDIVRRVLISYFGYDVQYIMNITDIDDKIIKRARQQHLVEEYIASKPSKDVVIQDLQNIREFLTTKLKDSGEKSEKREMYERELKALQSLMTESATRDADSLAQGARELLGEYLDRQRGHEVRDNRIFNALPRRWEEAFHVDMRRLNVLPPDVLTRVSEYVPEIVVYIERIIANGFAYVAPSGSVYFDTIRFRASPGCKYAKLMPESVGDSSLLAEGEGDLSVGDSTTREKRNEADFALWKASKPGEPRWPSPWSEGRPGWHIECSVMASSIAGDSLDLHSGGVDLKFPHHDNEIAQSEAYLGGGGREWVRSFLHSGHLTIAGCKMSKSLKNFVTIGDALNDYSARQIRMLFLASPWHGPLDYSKNTMGSAVQFEGALAEFFLNVKAIERQALAINPSSSALPLSANFVKFDSDELKLTDTFHSSRNSIHIFLSDNLDTPKVVSAIRDLVGECNLYIKAKRAANSIPNAALLRSIAEYLTRLLDMFGVPNMSRTDYGFADASQGTMEGVNVESVLLPPLQALSTFRERVRKIARESLMAKADPSAAALSAEEQRKRATEAAKALLQLSDELRDDVLPELGIKLEDFEGQPAAIKLVSKEQLKAEREERERLRQEELKAKEARLKEKAEKEAAAAALLRIPPSEFYRREKDKYSAFDEEGVPTHDAAGQPIGKNVVKKLRADLTKHAEKHRKWLAANSGSSSASADRAASGVDKRSLHTSAGNDLAAGEAPSNETESSE